MTRVLKLNCHALYVDTSFNSIYTALLNIARALLYSAMRYHVYLDHLRRWQKTSKIDTLGHIDQTYQLLSIFLRSRRKEANTYHVHNQHIEWLTCFAFKYVFQRRPHLYADILPKLSVKFASIKIRHRDLKLLYKVIQARNFLCFKDYVY